MDTNASEELKRHIGDRVIRCGFVIWEESESPVSAELKTGYTPDEYAAFLQEIDFTYDAGYGDVYVDGTIWYTDGTHSARRECDGKEWWEYMGAPPIPEDLQ